MALNIKNKKKTHNIHVHLNSAIPNNDIITGSLLYLLGILDSFIFQTIFAALIFFAFLRAAALHLFIVMVNSCACIYMNI